MKPSWGDDGWSCKCGHNGYGKAERRVTKIRGIVVAAAFIGAGKGR